MRLRFSPPKPVTEPVQSENAANESKKYDPEKQEQEPLGYTDEQKTEILEAAKKAGLEKVYVPTIGLGVDDYRVRRSISSSLNKGLAEEELARGCTRPGNNGRSAVVGAKSLASR
ncbi:hypothetical protein [Paenibacillus sp. S150]|uniref:hypothetical protein n=1 Tax=Paenibacillus sp. S150 TaxID=2749826 RepID=UPI001C592757|nr:hypothetical protein [Paenibacillus sp. S150]MBW4084933.1 hypothetical protein [Paenibacillus sp. S150]